MDQLNGDGGGGDHATGITTMFGQSQLKPKLDDIFAEVEKNLPSIDFDLSDVREHLNWLKGHIKLK